MPPVPPSPLDEDDEDEDDEDDEDDDAADDDVGGGRSSLQAATETTTVATSVIKRERGCFIEPSYDEKHKKGRRSMQIGHVSMNRRGFVAVRRRVLSNS